MELVAVADIDTAFAQLQKRIARGAETFAVQLRAPDGAVPSTAYWHERAGVWAILFKDEDDSRYWCSYGTSKPTPGGDVYYDCMINLARHDKPWTTAGALAADPRTGTLYYLHSGRIARRAEAFAQRYHGEKATVRWPNGNTDVRYVVGKLSDKHFVESLARFVKAVAGVKENAGTTLEVYYRTAIAESVDAEIEQLQQQLQGMSDKPGESASVASIRLQRLENLQGWLQDDPELLQRAVDTLTGRAVVARRKQIVLSTLAAVVSIVAGWLLSAVKPEVVLLPLAHLVR